MTQDKTPTDAEIAALYADETGFALGDSPAALLDFARAVLAKWGSPVVAGEPVGEAGSMPGTQGFTMACFHSDKVPLGTKLYTTPQPTQAQAGAVALTDEQLETAWNALQDRRATKAAEEFNARIGKNCSQCGTGAYRADGNGYHSFHRCDACRHVPMWTADGSEWSAPHDIKEGGQHV